MNPHYNQNYTKEEIDVVLEKIKSCVGSNKQKKYFVKSAGMMLLSQLRIIRWTELLKEKHTLI